MSPETIAASLADSSTELEDWWEKNQPPEDLIFDDGEPLESNRHRVNINILCDSLLQAFADRNDFFSGGNMFIYYSREQAKNRDFKGPDFFAVLGVDGSYPRQGWVVWDEDGRYPDVIIELMSPSTAKVDLTVKKALYEKTFKTADYFVYDPFVPNSLQGWHLGASGVYEQLIPNDNGKLWSQALGLWVGVWDGVINRETAPWLRFYDQENNLILLPKEAQEQEAARERQRAEHERQNAQRERQNGERERQNAESERQRAERLAARLRELGEDPASL